MSVTFDYLLFILILSEGIVGVHLTIIPRARVGYEMVDSQQGAKCRVPSWL